MKTYKPWSPTASYLLPPSPLDWLPEGHLAYFLLDVAGELDLSSIERKVQAMDHRGTAPYSPRMMVVLLLYGYCTGVYPNGVEGCNNKDSSGCTCSANRSCMELEKYVEIPFFMRQTMTSYALPSPKVKGLYD